MNYTKSKGDSDELICISKFISFGYNCSIPYGNGAPYDFIVDINGKMLRMQVKSSVPSFKYGDIVSFTFQCRRVNIVNKKPVTLKYDKSEIDYFVTVFSGQVYVVDVNSCGHAVTLRFVEPLNKGISNYRMAADYTIEKFLGHKPLSHKYSKSRDITAKNCNYCGAYGTGIICKKCKIERSKIRERVTRDDLKDMVREKSFKELGRIFGVSDKAISKWCINYGIPHRKQDINRLTKEEWDKV